MEFYERDDKSRMKAEKKDVITHHQEKKQKMIKNYAHPHSFDTFVYFTHLSPGKLADIYYVRR